MTDRPPLALGGDAPPSPAAVALDLAAQLQALADQLAVSAAMLHEAAAKLLSHSGGA